MKVNLDNSAITAKQPITSSHFTAAGGATGMEVSTGTEEVSTASATFAVGVEVPYVPASSKSLV